MTLQIEEEISEKLKIGNELTKIKEEIQELKLKSQEFMTIIENKESKLNEIETKSIIK